VAMRIFFNQLTLTSNQQKFWVRASSNYTVNNDEFDSYDNASDLYAMMKQENNNTQFILHGCMDFHIWKKLALSNLAKRCSCIFWGTEIYRYEKPNKSIKSYLSQFIHMVMVKRLNKVVTLNPGDALLVNKYLKSNNAQVLPYPLIGLSKPKKTENKKLLPLKIMIGNSAASSNEHCYTLEQLAHLAKYDVEIIAPLNYAGSQDYIEKVSIFGKSIFKDKFNVITQLLDKKEYEELLSDVDISIFSHQRQQGLYVVYSMLLMGKPMFLRKQTSSYSNLQALGFEVYSTESLSAFSFEQLVDLSGSYNKVNASLIDAHFSEKALSPKWTALLNELVM